MRYIFIIGIVIVMTSPLASASGVFSLVDRSPETNEWVVHTKSALGDLLVMRSGVPYVLKPQAFRGGLVSRIRAAAILDLMDDQGFARLDRLIAELDDLWDGSILLSAGSDVSMDLLATFVVTRTLTATTEPVHYMVLLPHAKRALGSLIEGTNISEPDAWDNRHLISLVKLELAGLVTRGMDYLGADDDAPERKLVWQAVRTVGEPAELCLTASVASPDELLQVLAIRASGHDCGETRFEFPPEVLVDIDISERWNAYARQLSLYRLLLDAGLADQDQINLSVQRTFASIRRDDRLVGQRHSASVLGSLMGLAEVAATVGASVDFPESIAVTAERVLRWHGQLPDIASQSDISTLVYLLASADYLSLDAGRLALWQKQVLEFLDKDAVSKAYSGIALNVILDLLGEELHDSGEAATDGRMSWAELLTYSKECDALEAMPKGTMAAVDDAIRTYINGGTLYGFPIFGPSLRIAEAKSKCGSETEWTIEDVRARSREALERINDGENKIYHGELLVRAWLAAEHECIYGKTPDLPNLDDRLHDRMRPGMGGISSDAMTPTPDVEVTFAYLRLERIRRDGCGPPFGVRLAE